MPKILARLKKLKTFNIETILQHPTKSHRPIPIPQGGKRLHAVAEAVAGAKEMNETANKAHRNIERSFF